MTRPRGYTGALIGYIVNSGPLGRMSTRRRVAVVVFAFPVLMLAAAALYGLEGAAYVLRSETVEGTVVERYEWPGETFFGGDRTNYEPIFTYEVDGQPRRASVGSPHTSFDIEPGETAMIRVLPKSRGNVRLDTWQGLWFMPIILGGIGAVSLLLAGLVWLALYRLVFGKDRT